MCLDHGRIEPDQRPGRAARALRDAFRQKLIDVYFCTYKELVELVRSCGLTLNEDVELEEELARISRELPLPPITYLRGRDVPTGAAYAIVNGRPIELGKHGGPIGARRRTGSTNAFNAAAMTALVSADGDRALSDIAQDAGAQALHAWRGQR